jgi:uncharacterized protein (DUF2252 family)
MAQSALHFFRGTAIIQARDLADSPASGPTVQLCGDCHLSNFGAFATPERSLVFDINDFDETFPGPWEWDVKRLVASFVVAARYRGFSSNRAESAARSAIRSYRMRMSAYASLGVLEMWYEQIRVDDLMAYFKDDSAFLQRLTRARKKALSRTSEAVFPKLTTVINGRVQIVDDPPLIYHFQQGMEGFEKWRAAIFKNYLKSLSADRRQLFERFRFQDNAIKVVGVGSVGTRRFVSLLLAGDTDPLLLQIKEARRSVLEPSDGPSRFENQGERVVTGQRLMQSASDIFLGWATLGKHDVYARQLRDMKVSAEIESTDAEALEAYAEICGWALARAHAKAGDAATISGYLGSNAQIDDAMVRYAVAYADQVDSDFAEFQSAIRSGRLKTEADVRPSALDLGL